LLRRGFDRGLRGGHRCSGGVVRVCMVARAGGAMARDVTGTSRAIGFCRVRRRR
jgi:hypothetical protein